MNEEWKRLTVNQLIEQLKQLSEEDRKKEVICSYDCGYGTGVYGVSVEKDGKVWLTGD